MSDQAMAKIAAEFAIDIAIVILFVSLLGPLGIIPALIILGCRKG